jgi:WD40 repeat protein
MIPRFLKSLDADDIFISYSRADGEAYLTGIDAALSKRGYSCFSDKRGTDADPFPPATLFRKIRLCKTLVLLGTPGAMAEPKHITPEIQEFATANGTSRIIAISFDRETILTDWSKMPWHTQVQGKARERENPKALVTGEPLPSIVNNIAIASDYMKSKDRLRKYRNRALSLFASLAVISAVAAGVAWSQVRRAASETAKANVETGRAAQATLDAQAALAQAKAARDEAQSAKIEATKQKDLADLASKDAEAKTKLADAATRQAQAAEADARKQQEKAASLGILNLAGSLRSQGPGNLVTSTLLAAESMKRTAPPEAEQFLKESLTLLPRHLKREFSHDGESGKENLLIAFGKDGKHFATASRYSVRAWDLGGGAQPSPVMLDGKNAVRSLIISPDGRNLIATFSNGRFQRPRVCGRQLVLLQDWASPAQRELSLSPGDCVFDAAFSPSGELLATASSDGKVRVWADWATGPAREILPSPIEFFVEDIVGMAFSRDNNRLVIYDIGLKLRVWDIASGKEVKDEFMRGALSSDRRFAITIHNEDNTVRILDLSKGQEVGRMVNIRTAFNTAPDVEGLLEYSSPTKYLAIPGNNNVAVWRVEKDADRTDLVAIVPVDGQLKAMKFSPDGKRLAVADTVVRIWEMPPGGSDGVTPKELSRIIPESGNVDIAYGPDGAYLVVAESHRARVWESSVRPFDPRMTKDLLTEVCERLYRNLSREEWKRYIGDARECRTCLDLQGGNDCQAAP